MSQDLDEIIEQMPPGLDRAILDVVKFHVGKENAISRPVMLVYLRQLGFYLKDDRPMRLAINSLRKQGIKICSAGGTKGGYWMAANHQELEEFIKHEVEARAYDLHEQARAMRASAEKEWGRYSPEKQISMF